MTLRFFTLAFLIPSFAFSQAQTQSVPPASQATPLPLSGRAGQSGSVHAVETPVPGLTSSVNTLNTSVQVEGPYQGSVPGSAKPFSGKLSLREAIERGLEFNLGTVGLTQAMRQAHGQMRMARSSLLPNLSADLRENVQQINLRALGLRLSTPIPGFSIPTIVGPFNYFDLRSTLTQTVFDLTALHNYRSAQELVKANEAALKDARDLVVYAVAGAYFQAVAAEGRVGSSRAQAQTAAALLKQTRDRRSVGLAADIDVNRSLVESQTAEQRVTTLENDLAKQKINLARLVGLPPTDTYTLDQSFPTSTSVDLAFDKAFSEALDARADLQSAEAQVRAAERSEKAARAERLPSLAFSADYGAIGTNPAQSHGTFTVVGMLRVPIWNGGRTEGSIEQADAALAQRRAETQDLRGRIEADVRQALLDIETTRKQINVAGNNQKVARQTLDLTKQRFEAGIVDSVEVVQTQESVAAADFDYITSLFSYNLAKATLARAMGNTEQNLARFVAMP
ncbi:MAG TPA: TolC family protein [Bryobacteraceae bacterium]|jgi:outer membrane protein TolC